MKTVSTLILALAIPTFFLVTAAAQPSLGTSALLEGPSAGVDSVVLAMASPTDTWTATANAAWLHLDVANQSGTGSTNLVFTYDANPGPTRTGTLTIAGQTLTVTQAGSTYVTAPGPVTSLAPSGLNQTAGVAVDSAGNVYIADTSNNAIKKWTATNNTVSTLVASGLHNPEGVAVDSAGNVYIADTSNNAVKEWIAASNTVSTLVASGLNRPYGVAVDGAGNVYIADTFNNAIKKWIAASNTVSTLVASGLNLAVGVAVDGAGNVYIGDANNKALKKWTAANSSLTTLASGLGQPMGVAVDGAGNVYVADRNNNAIGKWTAANNTFTTLFGSDLNYPAGVAVDGAGNVYIADQGNNAVKELPRAFVDATARLEGLAAGNDLVPVVLPCTANLLAPFAPTSDQSWLAVTGITNGLVSFAFSANTGITNRTAHIILLGQPIAVSQATVIGQPESITVCAGSPLIFTVTPVATNLSFQWQVSGNNGVTFTNISNTATNASYTNLAPTVAQSGYQYQLIVSRGGTSVTLAPPAVLTVNAPATVSAGPNQVICPGTSTATLGGSLGGSATAGTWTSSGSGSFLPNATTLNSTYAPSAADIAAGTVTLTLTASGQLSPCPIATAQVVVAITLPAIPNPPTNQTVSAGLPAVFSVGASAASPRYQWQVSQEGGTTFTNISTTATNASYAKAVTTLADNGNRYRVVVSGACPPAATSSPPAVLTVLAPSCVSKPADIVGWWRGEGNGNDGAGTNNASSLQSVSFTNGMVGQAFNFSPASSTVIVPDSPSLRLTNQLTIEAWINMRTFSGSGYGIVSKVGITNGNNGYQLVVVSNTIQGLFNSPGLSWPSQRIISGPVLSTGAWYHIAFTYDQSAMKLYSNGQLVTNSVIGPQPIATAVTDLRISGADYHDYFDGLIDEPSVYNRALSASEIASIYNASSEGKCGVAPPAIISQPASQTVPVGGTAIFTVTATGDPAPSYQWRLGGFDLAGATGSSLALPNVQLTNAGNYSVVVSNVVGVRNSQSAVLTVVPQNLPANLTVCAGSPATFSIGTTSGGLSYQWQVSRDSGITFTNVSATATNASYTNAATTLADNGNAYRVILASGGGSVTSAPPAVLTVNAPATASAGGNQTICAGNSTTALGGSVGGGATGGGWTSSGTGSFAPDATNLNAAYSPSLADQTAGTVTLTLTSSGQLAPCPPATAQVVVTINALPAIANPPANRTVNAGSPAVFSVGATGAALSYQWQMSQDGGTTYTNVSNTATNANYTNAATTLADNGNRYHVIVSGACTPPAISSPPAILTVKPPTQPSLGTSTLLEGPSAGIDSVVLAVAAPTTTWSAAANSAWLHLSVVNQSGRGSTNLVFSYDANPGATRTGTLTIAGQPLTVTQAGSAYVAAPGPVTALVNSGLSGPNGVAVDGAGNVYVADTGNNAIKEWTVANNTVTTLVASGLNSPFGVAVDGAGNVYITDTKNNAIKEWTAANNTVTTLVTSSAGLNQPYGVAVDGVGNVYATDGAIKEWMAANNTVTTLVASGLNQPLGVAVDGAGNVYIADSYNKAIKEWIAANNTVTTLVSSSAGLDWPYGVAVDGAGNVYIADTWHAAIKKWTAANNTVTTLAASGLNQPYGVAVDAAGNVYIADTDNNAIKELPHAFVDPTAKWEAPSAGSDVLPVVLPATVDLLAPFAPTSDQAWLTITGSTNGVVGFAFGATTSNRMAHITLLGQAISITQIGGITQQPASLTVCGGSPAVFAMTAAGDNLAYQWQVSQDGGMTFTNIGATATNASYTNLYAALADNGNQYQVIVTGALYSQTSAPPAVLTVNAPATASAGGHQYICAGNSTLGLGGSVGGAATGGTWTSSGTGSFVPDATNLNATYTPSLADQTAGTVMLTLTSCGQLAPCFPAAAQVFVTINALPAVANPPTNLTVCAGSPAVFSVGATGASLRYQWQVSQDGGTTFTNVSNTATNAGYTNAATTLADSGNRYRVIVSGACTPPAISSPPALLTVNAPATASAGGNQTICAGTSTTGLGGSVGGAATGGTWTSLGTGSFAPDATNLNAAYNPSLADQTAGTVTLTLTSGGQLAPCPPVTAQVVVTINALPAIADPPANRTVNAGSPAVFSVGATGVGLGYQWQVSQDGGTTYTNVSNTATNAGYTNIAATLADDGNRYQVIVSGACMPPTTSSPPAVLTVNVGPLCVSEPAGLVGWWRGEGNGNDSAGTNNAYSLVSVSFTNGMVGQASKFNPANGTLAVFDSPSLRLTNQLTIEAWINMRTFSGSGGYGILSKVGNATGLKGYQFLTVSNTIQGLFNSPGQSWPSQRIISGPVISTGGWYHVAFTYDQSAMKLYCNGQLVTNSVIGAQSIATSSADLRISGADTQAYFDGLIDEPAVYNRALEAGEIAAIYNAGSAGKCWVLPVVVSQPASQTVLVGGAATFTVTATGDPAPSYQWRFGGTNLAGATGSVLALANVQLTNAGNYSVVVSNRVGIITSEDALLTVVPMTTAPAQMTVCAGSAATFSVGTLQKGLSYQWQVSGDSGITFINISNTATNASYTNLVSTLADSGNAYQVIITWGGGSVTSTPPSVLTVSAPATASADGNQTICAGTSTMGLGGSVGGAATGGMWSSSGTGSFIPDATTLDATYAPSAVDVMAGVITLTLTATGQLAPCVATTQVAVTIIGLRAITGEPASRTNCPGTPASFNVTALGTNLSYQWQVSADGGTTFTNISETTTNASYTNVAPTLAEDSGLQYQVIISSACTPSWTSAPPAILTIYTPATASAGGNQTICSGNSTLALGGVIGGGGLSGLWSSSGTGTFTPDATALNASYTPSADDIRAGVATLTLSAQPCGDTNAQLVVMINPTPQAPVTVGTAICGAGTASLGATGTGGTLNWYSDPALSNLVNTGPAFAPAVSVTTTYYVTEASGLGCTSAASPVTATVFTEPATASAGPNQVLPSMASRVQLAGSVSNATSGTWSGGSGTFSPNARTLNALYTPSAIEVAAGSWALTLTADPNPCGTSGTSTMSFSYSVPTTLAVNTNTSTLAITLCLDPAISVTYRGPGDLGRQCQSATNRLLGDMVLQFDDPAHPTQIALQDFHFTAMAPYHLNFKWTSPATVPLSVTIGTVDQPMTVSSAFPQTAGLVPIDSATGAFTLTNVPFSSSGIAYYSGTAVGSLDMNADTVLPEVSGNIHVTNETATVHLDFSLLETFYKADFPPETGLLNVTGYSTFRGLVDATGPTAPARYMVWNNGAGTGNWNISDANWNNGSATWNNGRPLDGAVFGATGIGTVNMTEPITASFIRFTSPGYTVSGSSLNLLNQCAITNDADAVIAGTIASGGLNKWGSGRLTLSGMNTYTNATTVGAGVLEYGNEAALGATSKITVPNGAEVFFGPALAGATVGRPIELSGSGVSGGALHTFVPGGAITFTGPISLLGNAQIYGQAAESSTVNFSSVVSGSHDVTLFAGGDGGDAVTFVLSAANTYTGSTYIGNNYSTALVMLSGGDNRLPTGTTLYLSSGAGSSADGSVLELNGNSQALANLQDGLIVAGPRSVRNSSGTASTLTLSNAAFSGTLEGNLGLTKAGAGTVTLSGANTYSGNTVIQAGTLALSGGGTLGSASSSVSLAAGATLDVSAVTGAYYSLGSSATLSANGTASPATINGALAGAVDLGSQPIILTCDGAHPPLTIARGTLSLGGNAFTVNTLLPLAVGDYPIIQQASGDIASTGTFPAAAGTAIAAGYRGDISVVGGQVILSVVLTALPSTTTLGPVPSPQTYGNVILSASVSPGAASGTVTFMDGAIVLGAQPMVSGTATFTPVANQLQVPGSPHAIRAVYSGDASYAGSLSSVSNLAVTARTVQVTGTKTYDGGALVAGASLTAVNNVDGGSLTIGGTAVLSSKSVGSRTVVSSTYIAPSRVQTTTTNTATGTAISLTATLGGVPVNGNTLVAVISTRATTASTVTAITQAGATWRRATQATGASGTTEIWYAPNVQSAGTSLTLSFASTRLAAVIMEYSGVFALPALDQTANATGSGTAAVTGTTTATTQANELCVAGIGLVSSSYTLTSPLNGFTAVANCSSGSTTASGNARVYALENVVSSVGAQSSGGTVSSSAWSGAIATFVGVPSLTLSGSMAPNYTLAGVSGAVTVSQLPITVAAVPTAKVYDATTTSTGVPTITPPLVGDDTATVSQAFAVKTVGASTLTPSISISDGNGGNNYAVTPTTAGAAITAKALQVTNLSAFNKTYDGSATETPGGTAAFLAAEGAGTGTTSDGKPYIGDSVSPGGTPLAAFTDKNVGLSKTVSFSGVTVVGSDSGNYTVTQQSSWTANITPRTASLGGSVTYNGDTAITADRLAVVNNVDGANLTLSGSAMLGGRNIGPQAILSSSYATPVRVQAAAGNTGTAAASSFTVPVAAAANGNTLVAVISTRGTSTSRVTAITQVGASWTRVAQAANSSGSTLEIWYAPNVLSAGTTVTISQASSLRSAAVVMEYSGVLSAGALDQAASTTGNSASPSTGTTSMTTQANELWLGGIGFTNSSYMLGNATGGFTSPTNAQSGSTSATANAKVYALEQIASATGTAGSGGTLSSVSTWSGAIATFKAQNMFGTLALGGSASPNYTLIGASSAVAVTPTNLTVTAAYNSKLYDGTVTAFATPTLTSGSIQVGDTAPAWTEEYADPNVGMGKTLAPLAAAVSDGNGGANYNVTYATAAGDITALQIASGGQPTNTTVCAGSPAVFSASAPALVTYQWQVSRDGGVTFTNISDTATNASYTEPSPTLADNGSQYQVVVCAGGGSVTSAPPALLTIHLCSRAHSIQSVVNNRDGTYTLNMLGTAGAQYYLVSSPNPEAPLADWLPVAGSTNTASSQGGTWSCVVSDPSPAHFRVVAVHPAP